MEFQRERTSEQEVEKKTHVNQRMGKVHKKTKANTQNQRTGKEKEEKVFLIQTLHKLIVQTKRQRGQTA